MKPIKVDWTETRNLKNLLEFDDELLKTTYYWMSWDVLRRTRNKYRTKARKVASMEKSPEHQPTPELDKLRDLFQRSGIDPEDVQRVNRVNVYQGYMKNADGEFETVDLISAQYVPRNEMTEDMFIRQAEPTIIKPTRSSRRKISRAEKTAIILPDIQAGYRRFEDGRLDPTHDPDAVDITLQIIKDIQPNQVILNGDNLDLPQFGRFSQESTFAQTLNPTLDYVHKLLAQIRANAPNTKITYLAGNHELRLSKYIMQYAEKLYGVRQAGTENKVLTVPFLLNLADIECDYKSGYPANQYWINERLKAIHGNVVRPAGKTAAHYATTEETSTLFGHVHRHEYASKTAQNYSGARYIIAQSFGCLARIDGAVPSFGNGFDEVTDEPLTRYENWQQGLGFVAYQDGDKPFDTQQISIQTFNGYETRFNGKVYTPTSSKDKVINTEAKNGSQK